jgi:hypothetical protein
MNRMMTPCILLKREKTGEDKYGDATYEDVEVETVCSLQPQRRDEHDDTGTVSDTLWNLFLPSGTEADALSAVVVHGHKYELVGEGWEAQEGSRTLWHVEATVRRAGPVEGDGS